MRFSVKDFRCFHNITDVDVKPINILVGENSAGKTSFLAAVRFLLDLFQKNTEASFNKDPFYLGAYEQIAHVRGGRAGRATEFSFKISAPVRKTTVRRVRTGSPAPNGKYPIPESFELEVIFTNRKSQPYISKLRFSAEDYKFEASIDEMIELSISTPSNKKIIVGDQWYPSNLDPLKFDLSYIGLILRDFTFFARGESQKQFPKSVLEELYTLERLYRSVDVSLPNVYASAPVRSKPERTYDPQANPSTSGQHIPFIIAQIEFFDEEKWTEIETSLSEFGMASGLFNGLNIRRLSKDQSGPFQLIFNISGKKTNIIDIGYGVSQVLPIVIDLLRTPSRTTFLFQQPEVHLHPRAQAELATFFSRITISKKHTIFLETHSDYIIDRFRVEIKEGNINPQDVSLLYFHRDGGDVSVYPIKIDKKGNLIDAPPQYRRFFVDEELRSLGVEI